MTKRLSSSPNNKFRYSPNRIPPITSMPWALQLKINEMFKNKSSKKVSKRGRVNK